MTIKRRLFLSNILMIAITVIMSLITVLICIVILNAMFGGSLFEILKERQQSPTIGLESIGITYDAQMILLSVLVIVCITGTVYFTNRFLTKFVFSKIKQPLETLVNGVHQISDGNLDYRISYDTNDEFKSVCEDFNSMADRLKTSVEEVRKNEQNRNFMLAGISHDLRTPLTSIKNYVKGLRDGIAKSPEKEQEYLDVIYRKSCEMEGLIDQLFLFAKLETGNLPFNFKPIPIQKYIVTLLDSLEDDLRNNHAVINLASDCGAQKVLLDGEQMRRVISNILYNSVKHNKDKEICIVITLYQERNSIFIRIKDDGTGVSEEQASRLFDNFYRGDEARSNPSSGSGLGLSIAKMIVTAHGGNISAENDNGLAIVIELPIEQEDSI